MAVTICPSILSGNQEEYKRQIVKVTEFAKRVHIDLADGVFAATKTLPLEEVWWPGGVRADLHLMYQKPFEHYKAILSLGPQMVIVHAEADGNFVPFAELMHRRGIETGVALRPETPVDLIRPALEWIDHVVIFSGDLGHFGGQADMPLTAKIKQLRALKPQLEISWDGGVNNTNVRELVAAGADVLNVGGFIQHAADPRLAYDLLARAAV